ncbi:hypothetical protein D3C76_1751400 [compost metagenome]
MQPLEPGNALEYANGAIDQGVQIRCLGRKGHVPGLDARDIQDVANQLQQTVGRRIGDLQRFAVRLPVLGLLDRQLQ